MCSPVFVSAGRSDTLLPPVDRDGLTPQAQTDPVTAAPYRPPHGLLLQVFIFWYSDTDSSAASVCCFHFILIQKLLQLNI